MIRLQDNTVEVDFTVPILLALMVANDVFAQHGYDCELSSGSELGARHSRTSLHYSGNAADLRTQGVDIPDDVAQNIEKEIREALNVDYDVVLEPTHLHIEYQPRGRY